MTLSNLLSPSLLLLSLCQTSRPTSGCHDLPYPTRHFHPPKSFPYFFTFSIFSPLTPSLFTLLALLAKLHPFSQPINMFLCPTSTHSLIPFFFFFSLLFRFLFLKKLAFLFSCSPASAMDVDGSNKKLRKPYTITKSRDRWSDEEHERFLDGLLLFGREWKKIEDFVGTKTVIQIRSHAQKYFLKVQKNGLLAHVPPPRPKRNHAYPYPQKSSEDDMLPLQSSMNCPSTSSYFIPQFSSWDEKSMLRDYTSSGESMSLDYPAIPPGTEGDSGSGITGMYNQKFIWAGSSSKSPLGNDVPEQGSQQSHPVIPNFAEVYNLIATIFEPEVTNAFEIYMQKLKEMDPITAKTALILMKNLTVNLSSPEFKPLGRWLLTCDANCEGSGEAGDAAANESEMHSQPSQCAGLLPMN